jgi:hypothetical protein
MDTQADGHQNRVITCAPLIALALTVVTHALFYKGFLLCAAGDKTCVHFEPGPMLRGVKAAFVSDPSVYVGGAMWTLAGGLHVLVSLSVLIVAVFVIREGVGERVKGRRGALTVVLIFAWAAAAALLPIQRAATDVGAPAPRLLLETVGRMLPDINTYNRLFDALGMTVGIMLAVAACAVIRGDAGGDTEALLSRRLWLLRRVLYAGAAALVVSVVRLSVTLNWGGNFLPAPETPEGKAVSTLITGIVNALGIYYTLLLAAVYVPAALVLRGRVQALVVASGVPPEKREEFLKARGLALSYAQYLPRLVAILSPLLAGPFAELLKTLLGGSGGN